MQGNPQLNAKGELQHLLSIEGLPPEILTQILDTAESFMDVGEREVKKVPLLRGKSIFNLFFRGRTKAERGTVKSSGLGLAIARELVEAHGGQIAVVPGGGGHFRVTLPRRSARALADAA